MAEQYDHLFKLLLVGDSGVGKTSILLRYTAGEFKGDTRNTVGVDLKVKMVNFRGTKLKLTIWDTAGQERFRTLTSAYYRGAHGIVLVYDITARDSFENLQHWLSEVDIYSTNEQCVKLLIGNKSDMGSERTVSKKEGQAFAREHNMLFIEASAKTQDGINQAFDELMQKILDVPELLQDENAAGSGSSSNSGSASMRLDDRSAQRNAGGGSCGGFCA